MKSVLLLFALAAPFYAQTPWNKVVVSPLLTVEMPAFAPKSSFHKDQAHMMVTQAIFDSAFFMIGFTDGDLLVKDRADMDEKLKGFVHGFMESQMKSHSITVKDTSLAGTRGKILLLAPPAAQSAKADSGFIYMTIAGGQCYIIMEARKPNGPAERPADERRFWGSLTFDTAHIRENGFH
ncbi:hypothetical protein [Dinghuibacter silviterrae]|uniref:Uncharacterized protein n=1 Tax=Dinghuibacter silviterrae TaxID=1539049 RepID=A0A4R8DSM6_9BACT|nr:hypothetical protein [Dinghuibacter silviterrae]TDX00415.1 hypothetical protein EDB95_1439 [Dinghuibacter silviterrae]